MMHHVTIRGLNSVRRTFLRLHRATVRETDTVLKQEARALAVQYGRSTSPPDEGGGTAVEGFRERVRGDVAAVYPVREQAASVYRLMREHAPHLAKAYWHAFKSGKTHRMAVLVRQASLPQGGANARQLKSWRTGKRGRVDRRKNPAALVRRSEQRRQIRDQQGLIGVAKAGWHQAAKGLGGRVRRNLESADGKRTTAESFPAYVRKVSRKVSGLGGATVRSGRVSIFSSVRHAVDALPAKKKRQAEAAAQHRFQQAMERALDALYARMSKAA